MNHLMTSFRERNNEENMASLVAAIKNLNPGKTAEVLEHVRATIDRHSTTIDSNTAAMINFDKTFDIKEIIALLNYYNITFSAQAMRLLEIKTAIYRSIFLIAFIACELLWIALKR